jgi:hypothetical protein
MNVKAFEIENLTDLIRSLPMYLSVFPLKLYWDQDKVINAFNDTISITQPTSLINDKNV